MPAETDAERIERLAQSNFKRRIAIAKFEAYIKKYVAKFAAMDPADQAAVLEGIADNIKRDARAKRRKEGTGSCP